MLHGPLNVRLVIGRDMEIKIYYIRHLKEC